MQNRILKNTLISCMLVVVMSVFTCVSVFSNNLQETMQQQAYSQTMLMVHILETSHDDPVTTLSTIENEIYGRITFVDSNGKVVYDSDYATDTLDSHFDRKEITEAMEKGIAMNQRLSDTSDRLTYYCAAKVVDKGVIRVAITSASMAIEVIASTSPVIWVFMLVFILAVLFLSAITTKRIVETIETYDIDKGEGEIYEELSPFVQKIKSQNDIIRRQLQTLTDEKLKLQSIFMNIKEGIVVCDSRMSIAQTNMEARKIFSFDGQQNNFMEAVDVPELHLAIEKSLAGETIHGTFSQKSRWYQFIASPNFYAGDKGAILIVLDITQQIESEQNRRRFTDNITHELKTPLTSIIGYSQLITNDIARPDDVKKFVSIIERNAGQLMEMINDIMKISSLESKDGFNKVRLQLDEIVSSVVNQQKLTAHNRNVVLVEQLEKISVYADENQMYQLVNNLVSNAIKYNKEDGKVDIKLFKDGENVSLTVADTGIGIPSEHLDKIFERFYVVDKSRNKNISSTGLGLSIVKHIVKAHDGTVTVDSVLGKGAEFIVKLPIE